MGSAFAPGGVTSGITKAIADDLTPEGRLPDFEINSITFSVYNGNPIPVAARCRVRFWREESGDRPGTAIAGFSFTAISFDPGVTILKGDFTGSGLTMPPERFWCGMQFDNQGAPATTSAMLDNFGQGQFDPPDIGSSADEHWVSTNAVNVLTNNPVGTTTLAPFSGSGGAVANYAWEWNVTIGDPTSKSSWGRIKSLYR